MKLSTNFELKEFLPIDGNLTETDQVKVFFLVAFILQPLRDHLGSEIIVTNGKRTPTHNAMVGGSPTSDHLYEGFSVAADIVTKLQNEAWLWLLEHKHLMGQLIGYKNPDGSWKHFHVSLPTPTNHAEVFIHQNGRLIVV